MKGTNAGHSIRELLVACATAVVVMALFAVPSRAHTLRDAGDERDHIEARARRQIGEPWSYGGESPGGFDCSGLTRWVYMDHGATLPHSSLDQFKLGKQDGHKRIWKRRKLKRGDLVFHKTTSARVGHVGIYLGHDKFISTTSSSGVQVRDIHDPYYWGPRWVGATRVPATMGP
jgi:peptidoglycan DL-endopeptidase LytE